MKAVKRIVVIGGGTGVFTVLSGLKTYPHHLAAIVSMADDGGSTGVLREEFGILPPGDVRRVLVALARTDDKLLAELFNYRFKEGWGLEGHSFGNLLLTALERITGDFRQAIREAGRILGVDGEVIPVTTSNTRLFAELENGQVIEGETNIDIPKHNGHKRVQRLWLKPRAKANPEALQAIKKADAILLGPGDIFTSIIPNLLVSGIAEAIRKSRAKKVYICNLMTKFGETYGFKASDFLAAIEHYLGKNVLNYLVVNVQRPRREIMRRYIGEKADVVEVDEEAFRALKKPSLVKARLLRKGSLVRHDPIRLARLINLLI